MGTNLSTPISFMSTCDFWFLSLHTLQHHNISSFFIRTRAGVNSSICIASRTRYRVLVADASSSPRCPWFRCPFEFSITTNYTIPSCTRCDEADISLALDSAVTASIAVYPRRRFIAYMQVDMNTVLSLSDFVLYIYIYLHRLVGTCIRITYPSMHINVRDIRVYIM